ncbi:MAG: hypothetical protein KGL39_15210 [Patescibacteria group bacterium]|nr:hypothetical protein [Patescibacteria group bacterium]
MHRVIGGRIMRVVSLESDPLAEQDENERSLDRLMRAQPTPASERRRVVRTRNGNLVAQVAR